MGALIFFIFIFKF